MTNTMCPIYISVTTIFQRQHKILKTLKSIINQTRKPDKIFLHISENSYLGALLKKPPSAA